jgi:hypothetical protein
MAAGKWRVVVVFDRQLDRLRDRIAFHPRDQRQREIEPRGYAAAGHDIAILDDTGLFVAGAHEREQMRIAPVRRRAFTLEQPCAAEQERAGADARHQLRASGLTRNEVDRRSVV